MEISDVLDLEELLSHLHELIRLEGPSSPPDSQAQTTALLEELCSYLSVGGDTLTMTMDDTRCLTILAACLRVTYSGTEDTLLFALRSIALVLERHPVTTAKTFGILHLENDVTRLIEFGALNEAQLGDELLKILNVVSQCAPTILLGRPSEVICLGLAASRGHVAQYAAPLRHALVIVTRVLEAGGEGDWATSVDSLTAFFAVFRALVTAAPRTTTTVMPPNARVCLTLCCIGWAHACNAFGKEQGQFTFLLKRFLPLMSSLLEMDDLAVTRTALLCLAAAATCNTVLTISILLSSDAASMEALSVIRRTAVSHNAAHKDVVNVLQYITQGFYARPSEDIQPVYLWGHSDPHVLDFVFTPTATDFDSASQKIEFDETTSSVLEGAYREYRATGHTRQSDISLTVTFTRGGMRVGSRGSECPRNLFRCPLPASFGRSKKVAVRGSVVCSCVVAGGGPAPPPPESTEVALGCCGLFKKKPAAVVAPVVPPSPTPSSRSVAETPRAHPDALGLLLKMLVDVLNSSFVNTVVRDTLWCLENVLREVHRAGEGTSDVSCSEALLPALDALLSTGCPPFVVYKGGEAVVTMEGEIMQHTVDCLRQLSASCNGLRAWQGVLSHVRSARTVLQREGPASVSTPCPAHPTGAGTVATTLQRMSQLLDAGSTDTDGSADDRKSSWTWDLLHPVAPHCTESECGTVRELERRVVATSLPLDDLVAVLRAHLASSSCQYLTAQRCPALLHWLLLMAAQHIPRISEAPPLRSIFSIPDNVYWISLRSHSSLFERLHSPLHITCTNQVGRRLLEVYPFVTVGALGRHLTNTALCSPGVTAAFDKDLTVNVAAEYEYLERTRVAGEGVKCVLSVDDTVLTDPQMSLLDAYLQYSHAATAIRKQTVTTLNARRTMASRILALLSGEIQFAYHGSVVGTPPPTRVSVDMLSVPPLPHVAHDVTECLVKVTAMAQTDDHIPLVRADNSKALWNKLNYYTLQEILHAAALFVFPSLQTLLGGTGLVCLSYISLFPSLFSLEARFQLFYQVVVKAPSDMIASFTSVVQIAGTPRHGATPPLGVDMLSKTQMRPLKRIKLVVSRDRLLDHAIATLSHMACLPLRLEVEFAGEVGTGEGPIKEFYHLLGREVAAMPNMWRVTGDGSLFLLPVVPDPSSAARYRFLGHLLGKALQEKVSLDLPLHVLLLQSLMGDVVNPAEAFRSIDPAVAASLDHLDCITDDGVFRHLDVRFTVPGDDTVELCPGGADIAVDVATCTAYTRQVRAYATTRGVAHAVSLIREGFSDVIPIARVRRFFTTPELHRLLCGDPNHTALWPTAEAFLSSIQCDHGYVNTSPPVLFLAETLAGLSPSAQRDFLQFASGVRTPHPVLGLQPQLTVVLRACEGPADTYLPTVNTCFHYLKLPPYSTADVLRAKLLVAIAEGQQTFQLS